jgi:hypothetical protein
MKAIVQHRYRSADVLELRDDVEKPQPGDNELLIRVHAAGVDPQRPGQPGGSAAANTTNSYTVFFCPFCHNLSLHYCRLLSVRGRSFLNQGEPSFRRFTYKEGKRCMLVLTKLEADFSAGCARYRIGHLFLATLPPP